MKNLFKKTATILAISAFLTGCASMYGDNTRLVKVDSQPQGADIYIDGARVGKTPAVITLSTYIYGGKTLVLRKENFSETSVMVNSKFQPVTIWNILNGFGFLIDAATGNILKIDPANLSVQSELTPIIH
ncbi:PEGA domain-containing protein [Fluviispira sanaruensis]|uniref:PEGA domain-containing protein n=1 Tax=Fluviispira sanaruensis TaxID=2493639 RepID=A0A4P2VN72_FLUSA|nr:PEGA domain-containing protein [Fluviispira sanaruensis]BBH53400.1 PEGA domain-containing protein [Fluviispira sanaruensis]